MSCQRLLSRAVQAASLLVSLAAFGSGVCADQVQAKFLGVGIYATKDGCEKLAKLNAGQAEPNVSTVPETLSASGFKSWEGSCSFKSIDEITEGKAYKAKLSCIDGGEEWEEADTITRNDDGSYTVIVDGEEPGVIFHPCSGGPG